MTNAFATPAPDSPFQSDRTRHGIRNRTAFLDGIRQGIYPVVPDPVAGLTAGLTRLAEMEARPAVGLEGFCQSVIDGLQAGKPMPAKFGAEALKAEKAGEEHRAERTAVLAIRHELDTRFPKVVRDCLTPILGGLRSDLIGVMNDLRALVPVLGDLDVTSGEEVAAATEDQRTALLRLDSLRRRYDRLRQAHLDALNATSTDPNGLPRRALQPELLQFSSLPENRAPQVEHPTQRFLDLAGRSDVWLPDPDDLAALTAGRAPQQHGVSVNSIGQRVPNHRTRSGDLVAS